MPDSLHSPHAEVAFNTVPACLQMLSYGCTRLEIGLQSIYEDVARDTNRGHTVAAVSAAAQHSPFSTPSHSSQTART